MELAAFALTVVLIYGGGAGWSWWTPLLVASVSGTGYLLFRPHPLHETPFGLSVPRFVISAYAAEMVVSGVIFGAARLIP